MFNFVILFGIFLHLCVGIWIYGNPDIIVDRNETALKQVDQFVQNILTNVGGIGSVLYTRINYSHNYITLGFLCVFTVTICVKYFFLELVLIVFGKCCKNKVENAKRISLEVGDGIIT
jgi:hypothetical protein